MRLLAEANAAAALGEHILRLVTPSRTVMTGLVRFKTFAAGEFDRVSFLLDGKPVLTKRRPPYSVELDPFSVPPGLSIPSPISVTVGGGSAVPDPVAFTLTHSSRLAMPLVCGPVTNPRASIPA